MVVRIGNFAELTKAREEDSYAYLKHWMNWLGIGSAAGAFAILSLAAQLDDPDYVIGLFLPSLWSFAIGVIFAGASVIAISVKLGAMSEHYASAHNRAQIEDKIQQTPEVFASPQRLADEANVFRNKLVEEQLKMHVRAEETWNSYALLNRLWLACVGVSAIGFIFGVLWPLFQFSMGKTLSP